MVKVPDSSVGPRALAGTSLAQSRRGVFSFLCLGVQGAGGSRRHTVKGPDTSFVQGKGELLIPCLPLGTYRNEGRSAS